jgi:hypothetical protein
VVRRHLRLNIFKTNDVALCVGYLPCHERDSLPARRIRWEFIGGHQLIAVSFFIDGFDLVRSGGLPSLVEKRASFVLISPQTIRPAAKRGISPDSIEKVGQGH